MIKLHSALLLCYSYVFRVFSPRNEQKTLYISDRGGDSPNLDTLKVVTLLCNRGVCYNVRYGVYKMWQKINKKTAKVLLLSLLQALPKEPLSTAQARTNQCLQ